MKQKFVLNLLNMLPEWLWVVQWPIHLFFHKEDSSPIRNLHRDLQSSNDSAELDKPFEESVEKLKNKTKWVDLVSENSSFSSSCCPPIHPELTNMTTQ